MRKTIITLLALITIPMLLRAEAITLNKRTFDEVKNLQMNPSTFPAQESLNLEAPTRANEVESFDFTYAYNPYTAVGFGEQTVGIEVLQAFVLTPELATRYAGATIKSINFYNGSNNAPKESDRKNNITSARIFIMDGLNGKVLRTQETPLSEMAHDYNTVDLADPYMIEEGHEIVVGYSIVPTDANETYVVIDGVVNDNPNGCYVGIRYEGQNQWMNFCNQVGNLCIGMTIVSRDLPKDGMQIYSVTAPNYVLQNEPFTISVALQGDASNAVENIEVEYTIGKGEPQTAVWNMPSPIEYHQIVEGDVTNLVCTESGEQDITFTIKKVNGNPNTSVSATSATVTLYSTDPNKGFPRNVIVEEGTGTWCQWCPAGIVFMEWLKENHPEVIREAVHWNDEMAIPDADCLMDMFPAFPLIVVNRAQTFQPTDKKIYNAFEDYLTTTTAIPSLAEITNIEFERISQKKGNIKAKVRFASDLTNHEGRFGLSFSITEDGIGPYSQQNAYYGGSNGPMGGWQDKGILVPTIYDDVLCLLEGEREGFVDAFPEDIKENVEYEYEKSIYLNNVTSENFYLNGIVTDNRTGEVLNCQRIYVTNSGVNDISSEDADVVSIEYFNLNGLRVKNPQKGIFIKQTKLSDGSVEYCKTAL